MAQRTITSANSQFLLAIPGLYDVPQRLQGYMADAAFATDDVNPSENIMGVDGIMSSGYTPYMTPQSISLQADSESAIVFENWLIAMKAVRDIYFGYGTIILPGLGRIYTMTKGALSTAKAIPDAEKVLKGRTFKITWESVDPSGILDI